MPNVCLLSGGINAGKANSLLLADGYHDNDGVAIQHADYFANHSAGLNRLNKQSKCYQQHCLGG